MTEDELKAAEEAASEINHRLGRRLARLKLLVEMAVPGQHGVVDPVIENEMRLILHALIDVSPLGLVEVLDDFERYVQEAREQLRLPPPDPPDNMNGV